MMHVNRQILTSMLLVVLALAAGPVDGSDVRHVHNGTTPRDGLQTVVLEELWRVGDDEDDVFFGRVPRVETDKQGNIYILDTQLCQVSVYSPSGDLLRTLFREGEGPGEVLGPRDMFLMPDGGVGLVLEELGMVKFVDAGGDPAGSLRLGSIEGGYYALVSGAGIVNGVILAGRCSTEGETRLIRNRRNFLVRSDLDGNETAVFAENHWIWDFAEFNYVERDQMPPFHWGFDVGADGRIYAVVERGSYAVSVFAPDGTLELVIERNYAPLNRTKADRERFSYLIKTSMEGMPREMKVEQEDTYPAISFLHRGLQVTSDGFLWVLSGRGMKPEAPEFMAIYDVFDRNGVFVHQAALVAPHEADQVGIVFAGENRVIVIKGFLESLTSQFGNGASFNGEEWSNPEVIVYEMKGR